MGENTDINVGLATVSARLEALDRRLDSGFADLKAGLADHRRDVEMQGTALTKLEERMRDLEQETAASKAKFVLVAALGSTLLSIVSSLAVFFITR